MSKKLKNKIVAIKVVEKKDNLILVAVERVI